MAKSYVFRREEVPATEITKKEIQTAVSKDLARRAHFLERRKIMRDQLKQIIQNQLYLMFALESYQDMVPYIDASNNLARRVLRETSVVYKDSPVRAVTPKGAEKRFSAIVNSETGFHIDGVFSRANYLLNGLNDLIFQVALMGETVDLHIYTPDMVTVFENPDNPKVLDAILIEDSFISNQGEEIKQWIFWSPTRHFLVDKDFNILSVVGNEEMLNPFRDLNLTTGAFYPFIDVHASHRENEFWDQYSGTDLFEGTKLIAIQDTFRNFMVPMQFKQIAVKVNGVDDKGAAVKSNQIKSPLHVFTANGDISVLDWQSNILQLGESIQNKIFGIAGNYGISQENFKLTAQATSGFSRMVANERLLELRQEQVKIWRDVEVRMFDLVRAVNNFYGFPPIADQAKFSIDFAEPKMMEDPAVEMDIIAKKLELGIISLYDVVRDENPDIETDEEAEEFIRKNIEIRNSLRSRFGIDWTKIERGLQNATGNTVEQAKQGNA